MSKCHECYGDNNLASGWAGWLWECPNMKEKGSDFHYERYECDKCGERTRLDYEEMR